jgi:hypothetical protein
MSCVVVLISEVPETSATKFNLRIKCFLILRTGLSELEQC